MLCCCFSAQYDIKISHFWSRIRKTCAQTNSIYQGMLYFFRHQGIKIYWLIQFLGYLRTLSLKFQKARTKIEIVLTLPCWLSQFCWDSQQGKPRTTSILVKAFWNFKLKVLKYSKNWMSQYILVAEVWHPLVYIPCSYKWCTACFKHVKVS